MGAPETYLVTSPEEALLYLKDGRNFLLKAATVLDDVGRADMTIYPLEDERNNIDWAKTKHRIMHGLALPISKATPYILQEYIGGSDASEWCTHATVWEGRIQTFVCCPSVSSKDT